MAEGSAPAEDLALYFLHWVTDLAGAEATPKGGCEKLVLKFPHHVLRAFLWSIPYLEHLASQSETAVMKEYLCARWEAAGAGQLSSGAEGICLLRLMVMAQAKSPQIVKLAFGMLDGGRRQLLAQEMAMTGIAGQSYFSGQEAHAVGPAFLIYYGPALLQLNNLEGPLLSAALRTLCKVYEVARAMFPASEGAVGQTVKIEIASLKGKKVTSVMTELDWGSVWVMLKGNEQEASVKLATYQDVNRWYEEGANLRIIDIDYYEEEEEMNNDGDGDDSSRVQQGHADDARQGSHIFSCSKECTPQQCIWQRHSK